MNSQSIRARVEGYQTILNAISEAPPEGLFVVSYDPEAEPDCRELTFGEFRRLTARVRAVLAGEEVDSGQPIVLMLEQGPLVMAAFVAAMELGAVPSILAYPTFKVDPAKYRHGLVGVTSTIRPALVLVDEGYPEELRAVIPGQVRTLDERRLPPPAPEVVGRGEAGEIAFLQHSAGTTGLQKGVALPHRSVLNQIAKLVEALRLSPDDRIVSWLPLYHDMGLVACFVLPLVCHLPVVMMSPTDWILRPEIFLQLAGRYRATLGWLPNFAFQFMARRIPEDVRGPLDLASLRLLVSTSEPIRAASLDEFEAAFDGCGLAGTVLQTSYGMAENTFAVTQSRIDGASRPPRMTLSRSALLSRGAVEAPQDAGDAQVLVSCGVPLPGCEVQIVDDASREPLGDGRVGELRVRSDCLFDGYFRRPEITAGAFEDRWYRTGDLGFQLDGDYYVLGRRDDVMIIGGRNVFPEDAESAAARHPGIRDGRVVAFGIENPELGTQDLVVVAEVQGADPPDAGVAAWIREEIVAELGISPRSVHLVPPGWIVKSTAGKPARSACREKYLKERGR